MRPTNQETRRIHRLPLVNPPSPFLARLEDWFSGQFRLRWSYKEGFWHLEQKAPPQFANLMHAKQRRVDPYLDEVVRVRDGYTLVMRLAPQETVTCPVCFLNVDMPIMETREVPCLHCKARGNHVVLRGVAYWPFNDRLISHIQSLDPNRNAQPNRRVDTTNARWQAQLNRASQEALKWGMFDALLDQLPRNTRPS